MPGEMPGADEIGQRRLIQICWKKIVGAPNGQEAVYQSGGNHDISKAKRREESLAEGADVNDARARIQSLHGRHRHALIAVLAVIVVFNDPRVRTMRPLK